MVPLIMVGMSPLIPVTSPEESSVHIGVQIKILVEKNLMYMHLGIDEEKSGSSLKFGSFWEVRRGIHRYYPKLAQYGDCASKHREV